MSKLLRPLRCLLEVLQQEISGLNKHERQDIGATIGIGVLLAIVLLLANLAIGSI